MFTGFSNTTCRCTFTICQCSNTTIGHVYGVTFYTSNYELPSLKLDVPKNRPSYSQFNRGAYGNKRKKR